MDQDSLSFRQRLQRLTRLDWTLFAYSVFGLAASIVLFGGNFWWPADVRVWLAITLGAPVVLPMLFAVVVVASAAKVDPWIDRESILWRWIKGVAVALGAIAALAIGVTTGAAIGTINTLPELFYALGPTILFGGGWLAAAWLWWSTVATIDLARLGREGRSRAAAKRLPSRGGQPRRLARVAADLSSPFPAIVCALTGLLGIALGVSGLFALVTQTK